MAQYCSGYIGCSAAFTLFLLEFNRASSLPRPTDSTSAVGLSADGPRGLCRVVAICDVCWVRCLLGWCVRGLDKLGQRVSRSRPQVWLNQGVWFYFVANSDALPT